MFRSEQKIALLLEGRRVYAVGDIHGCAAQLEQLTNTIVRDGENGAEIQSIVYLGDYVDRGPDSKGVIDRLLCPPPGFQMHFLRGNHEQLLLDFLEDPNLFRLWKNYGGQETLISYGVLPPRFDDESAFAEARDQLAEVLPPSHLQFLRSLRLSIEIGDYFFVHAGVRPGVPLESQAAEDLLSIRDEFLMSSKNFGRVVVHGHSPTPSPVRRRNRIGVDTGAYATGRLTAAVLEGADCRFLHT